MSLAACPMFLPVVCLCLFALPVYHRMPRAIRFTCLSTYASVYSLYLSINVYQRISLSVYSLYLSISVFSVYLLYLSTNVCLCLFALPVYQRMFRSICFTCLLTYVSVYLLYLSAYVRLPINVCLRLSICFTFLSSYVSVCPHTHTRARTHARTHVRTHARTHSMPSSNH